MLLDLHSDWNGWGIKVSEPIFRKIPVDYRVFLCIGYLRVVGYDHKWCICRFVMEENQPYPLILGGGDSCEITLHGQEWESFQGRIVGVFLISHPDWSRGKNYGVPFYAAIKADGSSYKLDGHAGLSVKNFDLDYQVKGLFGTKPAQTNRAELLDTVDRIAQMHVPKYWHTFFECVDYKRKTGRLLRTDSGSADRL